MELKEIKLITIIAHRDLKEELIKFLKDSGVSGYTSYNTSGRSVSQLKGKGEKEIDNVKIKVLTNPMLSASIMKALAQTYFAKHKMIVFEQGARVIRAEKFDKVEY